MDGKDGLHKLTDGAGRRALLARASISTTALSLVDNRLPVGVLALVMRAYLSYFRVLTGATRVEVYATPVQETVVQRLDICATVASYHVPWQRNASDLVRLTGRRHPLGTTATVHPLDWGNHLFLTRHGTSEGKTRAVLEALMGSSAPLHAELDLLDDAADNGLIVLFETVVDREFYSILPHLGKSRTEYLFHLLGYVRTLRDAWLARHGDSRSLPIAPVGIVFNPWHTAFEMQGTVITNALNKGVAVEEVRYRLLSLLRRYSDSMEGMLRRYYVGNSRKWELMLPEILQRGHFFDPNGIIPEMALLRHLLQQQPELADAITLEASPQAALLCGRFAREP